MKKNVELYLIFIQIFINSYYLLKKSSYKFLIKTVLKINNVNDRLHYSKVYPGNHIGFLNIIDISICKFMPRDGLIYIEMASFVKTSPYMQYPH